MQLHREEVTRHLGSGRSTKVAFYKGGRSTKVFTETVGKPAAGFANVNHMTVLSHERIDNASRSAV